MTHEICLEKCHSLKCHSRFYSGLFSNLQQVEVNKSQRNLAMANHDIPPDAVRDKKLCRLPLLDTSTLVGVFVEYIISPSQFYIRIYSRDSSELLEDMMIEMR